ncbi:hypothetical protein SETIT_4G114800v2 [Setaria italica]|uniref:RING-type E3 ubiquitin transferase n=2 Tax=Setaria TaxID=4554 RepID=K3Y122_SETIT|nr:RING-H2 finger protein ATL39 [Setaria italica]XP_034591677.1 RING-H2 finger protein ATL39-like [Setaria viridis]RCV21149.1 hypothetical protein SETIT_4G114800v2 [Setaria italica]TKW20826.1 hypothetical protein SEVIR_4G114500v2 [Setaria viridis]
MNATADVWVMMIGTMLFVAVVLVTKRSWCDQPAPAPVSPEESQRASLAALEPPVAVVVVPAVVLPHFPYARGRATETLVCAICLEVLRDGEACSEVPGCRHVFHGDCVGAWARSKDSCPLCRTKIAPGSGAVAAAADDMV